MRTASCLPFTHGLRGLVHLSIVLALVGGSGCEKAAKPGAKSDDATVKADAGKADAGKADKADDADGAKADSGPTGDCGAYAEALCKEFGAGSDNCKATKTVLDYVPPAACKVGLGDIDFTKKALEKAKASCEELVEKLCGDLEKGSASCDMVRDQKDKIPAEKCKGMLGQYDAVLADLKQRDERNKPLDAEMQKKIAADNAVSKGPIDAKVQIVEFSDFQCPYCSRAATATNEIIEKYGDKVRVVFRHFPLSFHKEAHLASQAALAANEEGKFWEFHDLMFENQRALGRADLEKYAEKLGLNMKKFKKALDDGTYKAQVDADLALGKQVNVSGTPTMFINGKRAANSTAADALSKEIDAALAE